MVSKKSPAVFVIVAIYTEIFPIGAIRGIISGVAIFMVNCKKITVFVVELSPALSADKPVYFQGLFSVITWRTAQLFQFPYNVYGWFCGDSNIIAAFFNEILISHSGQPFRPNPVNSDKDIFYLYCIYYITGVKIIFKQRYNKNSLPMTCLCECANIW